MINKCKERIFAIASDLAYPAVEIETALKFFDLQNRITHPPGTWDSAGRFYADELSSAVRNCRAPSRRYPYPEMHAARTAAHCAEMAGVDCVTHVRRIKLALDRLIEGATEQELRKLLKPGIQKRKAGNDKIEKSAA
jgi:hypothetical protein